MKTKQTGFTLIEVMITLAIIGMLGAISYPSYTSHIIKSKRIEAQAALVSFASAMEMWRMQNNNSYCDAAGAGGAIIAACGDAAKNDVGPPSIFSAVVPISGGNTAYNLTISSVTGPTDVPPNTYTLTATAIGSQASDGNLSITNTGVTTCSVALSCLNGTSW